MRKRSNKMAKKQTTTISEPKSPKTVKVSTLIKAAVIALAIIASFIAGNLTSNVYNDSVQAKAVELSSKLSK